MIDAPTMRTNAEKCFVLGEIATTASAKARYSFLATVWIDLAERRDRLDGISDLRLAEIKKQRQSDFFRTGHH